MRELVLLVAPLPIARRLETSCLAEPPFALQCAGEWVQGIALARQRRPDLVVLAPPSSADAVEACRRLRDLGNFPLVLMVHDGLEELAVEAFEAGADDCVDLEVSPRELRARLRAHLRRARQYTEVQRPVLRHDSLELDRDRHEARVAGTLLHLSPKEFALLEYVLARADRVVRREELLQEVWDLPPGLNSRTVDVHMSRLRQKLAGAGADVSIATLPGVGYKLAPRDE